MLAAPGSNLIWNLQSSSITLFGKDMKPQSKCVISILLLLVNASVIARDTDWTQWRGKDGRGISLESGLLQSWPDGGPKELWKTSAIGKGYCSPIIVDDTVYVTGDIKDKLMIFALKPDGNIKWKTPNGFAWTQSYPGSRASCNYSNGKLYNVNGFGRLLCLSADNGKPIWSVRLLEKYQSRGDVWGIIETVVIDDNAVYASISGAKGLVVALNKDTGEEIWTTDNSIKDDYTYSSPILATVNGRRQVISCGNRNAYGVDAKTGKLLWSFPHEYKGRMIAPMPTFADGALFVTNSKLGGESVTYRLDFKGGKVEKGWQAFLGTSNCGGIIVNKGVVYGSRPRKRTGFIGIDAKSGELLFNKADIKRSSVIFGDGRIYCQASKGTIYLLEPEKKDFVIRGELSIGNVKDFWAHPVIAAGKLYLRYGNTLYCYDIRKK
jgi:outer membrane protein assembly factor BamB